MSDLHSLSVWHHSFARHVEFAVEGIEELALDEAQVSDARACQMGKWLAANAQKFSDVSALADLYKAHDEFHRAAGRVVHSHRLGLTSAQQESELANLRTASAAVQKAIDDLGAATQVDSMLVVGAPAQVSYWDQSLATGIPLIDEQHQAIAELGAKLLACPDLALSTDSASATLSSFYRLLALHYDTEELQMKRLQLPSAKLDAHVKAHSDLLGALTDIFVQQVDGQSPERVSDIAPLLQKIMIDHVVEYDLDLADYR